MIALGLNAQHTLPLFCGIAEIVFACDKILPMVTEPTNSNKRHAVLAGKRMASLALFAHFAA